MRFIDNKTIKCPQGWPDKAKAAADKVVQGRDPSDFGDVWRELKDVLADLSWDKCWYCEVKQERSDNAVDHFRPKSKYKWLSFEIENFRYACTFCNSRRHDAERGASGGKADEFPLVDEAVRAAKSGDERKEQPVLLNPCSSHDPGLLDFLEDGTPRARDEAHLIRKMRAEESIRIYHLDHTDLVEKRRTFALEINEKINNAAELYDRVDTGDLAIDRSYNGHVRELKNAMSERSELSAFARKVIMGRRDIVWIESLVQTG
jgi:uncharacterized protein (TIGR02646 family)